MKECGEITKSKFISRLRDPRDQTESLSVG